MDINNLKKIGIIITFNNEPYKIIYSQHTTTARGGAYVRTKLKNLITGLTLEKTFTGSDKIKTADIEKSTANFLYKEDDKFFFMDTHTYEQFFLPAASLTDQKKFLKEGIEIATLIYNKNPVAIELPKKVNLEVIEAPPSIKGDSATTPTKTVTLETDTQLTVPIFIKRGDIVRINTETGSYVERV
ncbi:elongation factor P [Patescibacteria group bacterium AH-259-L05]|nr:elongation factor P [Patescibacteria group bacterium AH-259-L05]